MDGFGTVLLVGRVENAVGSAVINSNWSWRLWMTAFCKCCSHWYGKLGVHVEMMMTLAVLMLVQRGVGGCG